MCDLRRQVHQGRPYALGQTLDKRVGRILEKLLSVRDEPRHCHCERLQVRNERGHDDRSQESEQGENHGVDVDDRPEQGHARVKTAYHGVDRIREKRRADEHDRDARNASEKCDYRRRDHPRRARPVASTFKAYVTRRSPRERRTTRLLETKFMQQPYHIRAVSPGPTIPDMPMDPPYEPPQPGLPPSTPGGPVSDPPALARSRWSDHDDSVARDTLS